MPNTAVEVLLEPIPDTFTPHVEFLIARLSDMLPAYEEVYVAFQEIEKKRFAAEGPGWQPLADSTRAERSALGIGADSPILDRTGVPGGGNLKGSLTSQGHKNAVFRPEVDGVFMGTSDPVATFHQDGTDRMPARAVVDMTEADAVVFSNIIGDYLFVGPEEAVRVTGSIGL
jgi:hypothetical protein